MVVSDGCAFVRLSRSDRNSLSALSVEFVSEAFRDLGVGDASGCSETEPRLFVRASATARAGDSRFDHQNQPPIPTPPTNRRTITARSTPCHQRNSDGVSEAWPYDSM